MMNSIPKTKESIILLFDFIFVKHREFSFSSLNIFENKERKKIIINKI